MVSNLMLWKLSYHLLNTYQDAVTIYIRRRDGHPNRPSPIFERHHQQELQILYLLLGQQSPSFMGSNFQSRRSKFDSNRSTWASRKSDLRDPSRITSETNSMCQTRQSTKFSMEMWASIASVPPILRVSRIDWCSSVHTNLANSSQILPRKN